MLTNCTADKFTGVAKQLRGAAMPENGPVFSHFDFGIKRRAGREVVWTMRPSELGQLGGISSISCTRLSDSLLSGHAGSTHMHNDVSIKCSYI